MAATTAGALKAFIEGLGLSISVYRDRAPTNLAPPYVTVEEALAVIPDGLEDDAYSTGVETATVHVWMSWKNTTTGALAESQTLVRDIVRGLQGQSLPAAPTRVYAVLVRHEGPRMVDEEENVVHVPITVELMRAL